MRNTANQSPNLFARTGTSINTLPGGGFEILPHPHHPQAEGAQRSVRPCGYRLGGGAAPCNVWAPIAQGLAKHREKVAHDEEAAIAIRGTSQPLQRPDCNYPGSCKDNCNIRPVWQTRN